MAECEKVNIPKVDNTERECEEYLKGECIYMTNIPENMRDFFDLDDPLSMDDLVVKLLEINKSLGDRVVALENLI